MVASYEMNRASHRTRERPIMKVFMTASTLTILQDRAELDWLALHRREALTHRILTFDLELHLQLSKRGIDHVTPWDIITPADREQMEEREALLHRWWQEHAAIRHRNIDILKVASDRHIAAITRMVWIEGVVGKAIARLRPIRLQIFDIAGAHGLEQPPHCRRLPLLPAIARTIAKDRKIEVEDLSDHMDCQSQFEDAAARQSREPDLPPFDISKMANQPFVLLTGSGPDLTRQLSAVRMIEASSTHRVLQVYRYADGETLKRMQSIGHSVIHDSQLDLGVDTGIDEKSLQACRQAFNHSAIAAGIDFARRIPDSHLNFIFGEYACKIAMRIDRWQAFFARYRPTALVGHYPDVAMEVAVQSGIRCLMLPHGGMSVGVGTWYRSMPRVSLGVEGAAHMGHLVSHGISPDRIELIDPFVEDEAPVRSHAQRDGASDRFKVLLATSRLADHAHDAELPGLNWKAAIDSFRESLKFAAEQDNWEIVIKTHPRYDHLELYREINESLPSHQRARIVGNDSLTACASDADVVVFANVTSSAILEAAQIGKPVVLLRDSSAICRANPRDALLDGWIRVETVTELIAKLNRLASNASEYQSAVAKTHQAYKAFYGSRPKAGSLLDFIAGNKKTRFARNDEPRSLISIH